MRLSRRGSAPAPPVPSCCTGLRTSLRHVSVVQYRIGVLTLLWLQLLGMSEELASLGGGDTRVGKLSVHVRVCPTPHLASPIVTVADDVVSVR